MNPRTHMRLGAAATASISMALVLLIGGCSGSGPQESSAGTAGSAGSSASTALAGSSASTGSAGSSMGTAPAESSMGTAPVGSSMGTAPAGSSASTGSAGMRPNVDASQRPGGDMVPHHVGPSGAVPSSPPKQPLPGYTHDYLPGATPNDIVSNRPSQGSAPQSPTPQSSASQRPTQHNATSDDAKNPKRRTR